MTRSAEPSVYLRGQFLPVSQAALTIFDAGLILGATVTEMTRTFRHRAYRLEDHVDRLFRSAQYAHITPPLARDETLRLSQQLIERNAALLGPGEDLSLCQFLTPGEVGVYAGRSGRAGDAEATFCMHTFPLPLAGWRHLYTDGAHVVTPSVRQIPPQCWDAKMKCRSRMNWWLADLEARQVDPRAIALCLDIDGNITETSTANFLIVHQGVVISPAPKQILWGISLATVQELCAELKIGFQVRDLQTYDVTTAQEAMLSSTSFCLAPVTRVNSTNIGDGRPGPVFKRLVAAWSQRVGLDIVDQILRNDTSEP